MTDFGLSDEHRRKLQECFTSMPEIEAVYVFGSRARGDYGKTSDVDLAVKFTPPDINAPSPAPQRERAGGEGLLITRIPSPPSPAPQRERAGGEGDTAHVLSKLNDLPIIYKFDVVDLDRIADEFKADVERDKKLFYRKGAAMTE